MTRCSRCGEARACDTWAEGIALCRPCVRLVILEWAIKHEEVEETKTS